jgi:arylsulfatase A-like enzyme
MHFLLRLALLLLAVAPALPAAAPRVPNLIYIVSDDQGFDLACFGSKQFVTPHLDRMAAEGVRATNFYVTASVCTPSRSGAIPGRYPQRNGTYEMIRNNMVNYGHRYTKSEYAISPEMTLGLDVRELTFGDVLRTAGYHNACFGKWDLGQARRFLPLQRGFDVFVGSESFLLANMRNHGAGCISATANVNPAAIDKLYREWKNADADAQQAALDVVRKTTGQYVMIPALKAVIAHYAHDPEWATVRPPLVELTATQAQKIIDDLLNLGFDMPGLAKADAVSV